MEIIGLLVPLMKISILLISVRFLFMVCESCNGIHNIKGKMVKQKRR